MKDILKQIQEATENFDNLFEVDGLGDPASDVPPSTNKIKKDVKTKNGKVELVSVEDELFPKEGNAKEQFKQKVLDKINAMIQGTGTLEDLLQVVRSKQIKPVKEGFEGAVELLEEIIHELKDSTIENALRKRSDAIEKSTMGFYFPSKESVDKFGKLKELADKRAARQGKKLEEIGDAYGYTYKHKPVKEGFEGAIEILEQLLAEADHHANEKNPVVKITDKNYGVASGKRLSGPFNKNHVGQYIVYNKDTDASYLVTPDNWKKSKIKKDLEAQGKFYEALELLEEIINEVSDELAKKASEESHNRYWNARTKHDSLKKMLKNKGFFTDDELKDLKKDYKEAQKNLKKAGVVSVRDNKNQFNRDKRLGKLAEAQQLLEEIINEVSLKMWKQAADKSAPKRKEEAEKAKDFVMKSWDEYAKNSKKHPEEEGDFYVKAVEDGMIGAKAENRAHHADKVKYVTPNSKHSANKYLKAAHNSKDGENEGKNIWAKHIADMDPVKSRASESFEGAIEVIEQLLSETKSPEEVKKVAKKVLPQREAEAKKAHADVNRVTNINPYSMVNGKLSQKQREVIANAINKANRADSKVAKAKSYLEKPKEKQPSTEFKFDKILCNFEEAMDIIEATVGKLSTATANSIEQRQKEAQEAQAKAQKAVGADKVLSKAKADKARKRLQHAQDLKMLRLPKDSKVSANKLFKSAEKSLPDRENNSIKKDKSGSYERYKRAWNIADANPVKEALELTENLYKEINKKFNKGELSVDKALKLEKKVQDKISPEKRKLDGKELEAEFKSSLEPEIQVNKNLKALRRDDKRRNGGKSNYKFTFDYNPKNVEEALKELESLEDKIIEKYNKAFKKAIRN